MTDNRPVDRVARYLASHPAVRVFGLTVPCCPPEAFAHPAAATECVFIPEPAAPATRTALVLGVRVAVAIDGRTPPRKGWGR